MSRATPSDFALYGLPPQVLAQPAAQVSGVQQSMLDAAAALVDSYLRTQFTFPLSSTGLDIVVAECEVAAYLLLKHIGFNPTGTDQEVVKAYQARIAWLEAVATGAVVPDVTGAP